MYNAQPNWGKKKKKVVKPEDFMEDAEPTKEQTGPSKGKIDAMKGFLKAIHAAQEKAAENNKKYGR